jgi:hypothetical protein
MHPRMPRAGLRILLLALAASSGCADYTATTRATRSIYSVNVVTNAADVRDCRLLGRVNSRDESKCGLTVQPTPEECLRYQVRRAGGDTLLINGPIGDAYDCSGGTAASGASTTATTAAAPAPAAPAPASTPRAANPTAAPAAAPAPPGPAPTPTPQSAPPAPAKRARVVSDRGAARGCVYVGDLDPRSACALDAGSTEDCLARSGAEAGADTVVWDASAGSAQLFRCAGNATP